MKEKLEAKGISALLLPSASNSEEYNRYRVIVPTVKEFSLKGVYENWKEDYRAYIENFVDFLGIEEDKKKALDSAMFRPAQFYYGSAPDTTATLTNGKVFDNSDMLEKIYQEREKINANMQLKLKEKQYAKAQKNMEKEVDIVFRNLKENEDKLVDAGQDNDVALTRTVLSYINRVINVVDAARLRYPKAHIKAEGRYKILYTADQEQEGNRNLLGEFGAYNFSREKTRTSYDFMREYLEFLNARIKKFNDGGMPIDEKEKLKNFLVNSRLGKIKNEQPLEFSSINTNNGNNYAILVRQFFPDQYQKVCLLNYKGIAKNLMRYMKNIDDCEGLENFKKHYGIKFVDLKNGKIGFRDDLSLSELKAFGLSE